MAADFEFEVNEFQQAVNFIQNDSKLKEMNLVSDTINYFSAYTDTIKEVMDSENYKLPIVQAQMIAEISKVPNQYKMDLVTIVDLFMAHANPQEREVCVKIKEALR